MSPHLVLDSLGGSAGKEEFEISTDKGGVVKIAASGPNAAAVGLNRYLKYYCYRSMSHMGEAYLQKDRTSFDVQAQRFLSLSGILDTLLDTHPYYRLSTYQRRALAEGNTPAEKKNDLHNAMMLITWWGGTNPAEGLLHEYAYKEWAGLMTPFL